MAIEASYGEANEVKVGTFARNLATATGNQAVTGIGFEPKAVLFISTESGVAFMFSMGVDTLTATKDMFDRSNTTADSWSPDTASSINSERAAGGCQGKLDSLDADGFTVFFTKSGAPVGTLQIIYMAIK